MEYPPQVECVLAHGPFTYSLPVLVVDFSYAFIIYILNYDEMVVANRMKNTCIRLNLAVGVVVFFILLIFVVIYIYFYSIKLCFGQTY